MKRSPRFGSESVVLTAASFPYSIASPSFRRAISFSPWLFNIWYWTSSTCPRLVTALSHTGSSFFPICIAVLRYSTPLSPISSSPVTLILVPYHPPSIVRA
ncbi:hypothetical protein AA313_de0208715 [Arthrobotrys entomopaga]|nr:hypothetical protein AA313_de0208715 [Arthrobotrys entomopaga]